MAKQLNDAHGGNYMIWNLSEKSTYNPKIFEGFVHSISFPGHPAPPLEAVVSICTSAASWLKSSDRNVVVVHCMTGRGRTAVALSCLMSWICEANTTAEALAKVSAAVGAEVEDATIPSQRRYINYFDRVLDGVKPRQTPVRLRSFSVSGGVPEFQPGACRPYLQAYVNGKLVYTCASHGDSGGKTPAECLAASNDGFAFQVDWLLRGDILIRCRHLDAVTGKKTSMFRIALHTGYVAAGKNEFSADDLDGVPGDSRFPKDFSASLRFDAASNQDVASAPRGSCDEDGGIFGSASSLWDAVAKRKRRVVRESIDEGTNAPFSILGEGLGRDQEVDLVEQQRQLEASDSFAALMNDAGLPDEEDDLMMQLNALSTGAGEGDASQDTHDDVSFLDMLNDLESELGLDTLE